MITTLTTRQELWNADTKEIICNMTAQYGSEEHGSTHQVILSLIMITMITIMFIFILVSTITVTQVFNEADYLTILPCLFGSQADSPTFGHPTF